MTKKELFQRIVKNYIKREGIDKLLEMLDRTDFYTAPASSKYHSNYPEGLIIHTLCNYGSLIDLIGLLASQEGCPISFDLLTKVKVGAELSKEELETINTSIGKVLFNNKLTLESVAISALFHDFHKLNYYEEYTKSIFKGYDESGEKIYDKEHGYKIKEDTFVFGIDGTNSNYVIQSCIKLNYEEALAIENHMGYISKVGLLPSSGKAWSKSRLAALLHIADMMAAYVYEPYKKVK